MADQELQIIQPSFSSDEPSAAEAGEVPVVVSEQPATVTNEDEHLMRNAGNQHEKSIMYYLCDAWIEACSRCCESFWMRCRGKPDYHPRAIYLARPSGPTDQTFPANIIRNQKYNVITFVPLVLFEFFSMFLNMFFLVMACTQLIPALEVGYLYSYWLPLIFIMCVTLVREGVDDFRRFLRDREVNGQKYKKLTQAGVVTVESAKIKVGDLIIVEKDQRVPADMVLVRTSEKAGTCFIRTDQLDGETDWKLRLAVPSTHRLTSEMELFEIETRLFAEKPQVDIHSFIGTFSRIDGTAEDSLNIENTAWSNTVVATGSAIGAVIYTGRETRSVMNTSKGVMKVGL